MKYSNSAIKKYAETENLECIITNICKEYSNTMSYEEKESAAWSGLYYAFITHKRGEYDPDVYVRICVFNAIDIERRHRNQRFRMESKFSLDGYTTSNDDDSLQNSNLIFDKNINIENEFILYDFLSQLNYSQQGVAYQLINNSSIEDVIEILGISEKECNQIISQIKYLIIDYYGEKYITSKTI